jgi:hypothetical protein
MYQNSRSNYRSQKNQFWNQSQPQQKKRSGCESGKDKNDTPYVRGWKYDKTNGLRSFYACPYSKTKRVKSQNGSEWENWMIKVQHSDKTTTLHSCLYEISTKKVFIKEFGFVMNPKGGYKGYVGPYYYKSRK